MTAKCVGCGLDWNVSIYQKIPRTGYICPHCESRLRLTVDQYRRNRDVIPNADDWWWLSTAFSTKSNGYESLARHVDTDGTLNWGYACGGYLSLRPACYLDSDLLISIEDDEATDDVTPEHAGEIIAALAEQFGGTFATEDQLTTALSFMLGTLRATREKEARHE